MGQIVHPNAFRDLALGGGHATKSTGTLSSASIPIFTIAGGRVAITAIVGEVTTAVTVANAAKLQHNPTVGAVNNDLCTTLDIGTTDSPVGTLLAITGVPSAAMQSSPGRAVLQSNAIVLAEGQIEFVSAGTDGVVLFDVFWYPVDDGATLVAA